MTAAAAAAPSRSQRSGKRSKKKKEAFPLPAEIVTTPDRDDGDDDSRLTDPFVSAVVHERFRAPGRRQRRLSLGMAPKVADDMRQSRSSSMSMVSSAPIRAPLPRGSNHSSAQESVGHPGMKMNLRPNGSAQKNNRMSLSLQGSFANNISNSKSQSRTRATHQRRSGGDLPKEITELLESRKQRRPQASMPTKSNDTSRASFSSWLLNDHDPKQNPRHRPNDTRPKASSSRRKSRRSSLSSITENEQNGSQPIRSMPKPSRSRRPSHGRSASLSSVNSSQSPRTTARSQRPAPGRAASLSSVNESLPIKDPPKPMPSTPQNSRPIAAPPRSQRIAPQRSPSVNGSQPIQTPPQPTPSPRPTPQRTSSNLSVYDSRPPKSTSSRRPPRPSLSRRSSTGSQQRVTITKSSDEEDDDIDEEDDDLQILHQKRLLAMSSSAFFSSGASVTSASHHRRSASTRPLRMPAALETASTSTRGGEQQLLEKMRRMSVSF